MAATVGFAACGSAGEDGCSENASYASVVRFNGVLYTGSALSDGSRVDVGRPVGTGSDACGSEVTARAGAGRITFAGVALDSLLEHLAARGIEHELIGTDYVKIPDPDGNAIAFAALPDAASASPGSAGAGAS